GAGEQLVCRLPSDDPWMQNMLRPIVEAAGYRVVGNEHDGDADLVIASQGAKLPQEIAKNAIWLRAEAEASGKKDESIYRYDRAGLLMALKSAGAGRGKWKTSRGRASERTSAGRNNYRRARRASRRGSRIRRVHGYYQSDAA